MDIFILVGGFTIVCVMGMPVANAERIGDGHAHQADDGETADENEDVHDASPVFGYSVVSWLTVSGSGSEKNFCVRKRSMTNKTVSAPPIGMGR